jgi:hypothetical protein
MIAQAPTDFFDHFVCPQQLWNSPWGYAGSAPGCLNDGLSFKLGKVQVVSSVLTFLAVCYYFVRKKIRKISFLFVTGTVLLVLSVTGMIPVSAPFWSVVPFVRFIQYPWRLLAFSMLSFGLISGYIAVLPFNKTLRIVFVTFLTGVLIFSNAKLFRAQYTYARDASAFESKPDLQYRVSGISDEYLPPGILKPAGVSELPTDIITVNGGGSHTQLTVSDTFLRVSVRSVSGGSVQINRVYFPGWIYSVNGTPVQPVLSHDLPTIKVPPGESIIEGRFVNTQVRNIGNIISVMTILILGGLFYYGSKTDA